MFIMWSSLIAIATGGLQCLKLISDLRPIRRDYPASPSRNALKRGNKQAQRLFAHQIYSLLTLFWSFNLYIRNDRVAGRILAFLLY